MNKTTICWFSCGITSAVSCKLAIAEYKNIELFYINTGSQEEDSLRFLSDCEKWFKQPIHILKNEKYEDHFDVIKKRKFINSPHGAACTYELKKKVRYQLEDDVKGWTHQIFGFDASEQNRAKRFFEQYPASKPAFPLIESGITKEMAAAIIERNGIELPRMYKLGYRNNNCIGCVKGGMGYWNKIRIDFPKQFKKMAQLERFIGNTCLSEAICTNGQKSKQPLFLDTLDPYRGRIDAEVMPSCDLFCELEFMNI